MVMVMSIVIVYGGLYAVKLDSLRSIDLMPYCDVLVWLHGLLLHALIRFFFSFD